MKYHLTTVSIMIASMTCMSAANAMDSTGVLPSNGSGASIQKQTTMLQGYANIYTNYATYTQQPLSMSSVPTPPAACTAGDIQLATGYSPSAAVIQGCNGWSCPSCDSISDCGEAIPCVSCMETGVCSLFGCSCPYTYCSSHVYTWSTSFTGPTALASITCGTNGFVSHAQDLQKGATVSTQSSIASIQNAQLPQINHLIALINVSLQGGSAGALGAVMDAMNTALGGLETAWSAVSGFFCCVGCSIGDAFSGGGW